MTSSVASFDYDLFVIGAGSGGVRASRMAAQYGARVAVAEDTYLGGTCVNVGCVPKKLFVYASQFREGFRDAAGFGWQVAPAEFDWSTLLTQKNREISRLNDIYRNLLENSGVTIFNGRAQLLDRHTVAIGDTRVRARFILIATGGWPSVPEFPGHELVITSNEMFFLEQLPRRIVIVGGGYIAVEFAGIMHGLGVDTTLVYRGELFLRSFDRELREQLALEMRSKGIKLLFNANVQRIDQRGEEMHVQLDSAETLACDLVMYATGRRPRTANIGLENTGVALTDGGEVVVDAFFRTAEPNIYAIGDVIGGMALTPVALAQGMAVAKTLFRDQPSSVDLTAIPTAIFSQPNFASVGYTEEDAREQFADIAVYTAKFTPMKNTLSGNPEKMLMKLIVDRGTDRVVGVHMLGSEAGEIIQGLAVAMKAGASKADFDATLGIHPTAAEEFVTMRTRTR